MSSEDPRRKGTCAQLNNWETVLRMVVSVPHHIEQFRTFAEGDGVKRMSCLEFNTEAAAECEGTKHCCHQTWWLAPGVAQTTHSPHSAPMGHTCWTRPNHGTDQSSVGLVGTENTDPLSCGHCGPTGKIGDRKLLLWEPSLCQMLCLALHLHYFILSS